MDIKEIIKDCEIVEIIGNIDNIDIENICTNSDKLQNNSLYICINGTVSDSHKIASGLTSQGVVAFVCEEKLQCDCAQIIVKNSRKEVSNIARNFYGNPQENLIITGITGTNGKTSITYIMKSILEYAGKKVGIIGTLGAKIYNIEYNTELTTPDPITLYSLLKEMVDNDVEYVVMEVSAHALDLYRINGIKFRIGIFTNLTQDHLDYFGNMTNYKNAKKKLFDEKITDNAIVNIDDDFGREIVNMRNKVITYGIDNPSDCFAIDIKETTEDTTFVMNCFDSVFDVKSKLIGRFNVYNVLASVSACKKLGIDNGDISMGLLKTNQIDGRMEYMGRKNGGNVYIDYAHTPDGLENILRTSKTITKGKVVCLFGCGGNRDKSKRKIMGEIACKYSDFIILTSDNPRYEDPMLIINDIESGMKDYKENYIIISDRKQAIIYALKYISNGDTLLVCGKGAEKYQEILGIRYPFNDKKIITGLLDN